MTVDTGQFAAMSAELAALHEGLRLVAAAAGATVPEVRAELGVPAEFSYAYGPRHKRPRHLRAVS